MNNVQPLPFFFLIHNEAFYTIGFVIYNEITRVWVHNNTIYYSCIDLHAVQFIWTIVVVVAKKKHLNHILCYIVVFIHLLLHVYSR